MAKSTQTKTARSERQLREISPVALRNGLMIFAAIVAVAGFVLAGKGTPKALSEADEAAQDFDPALHMRKVKTAAFTDAMRAVYGEAASIRQEGGKLRVTLAWGGRTAGFYNNNPRLLQVKEPKLFSIRHDEARETVTAEFAVDGGAVQVPTDVLFAVARNFAARPSK